MDKALFSDLMGYILQSITVSPDNDRIEFTTVGGERFAMYHNQDCCENVQIEDITGDLMGLIGCPITLSEVGSNNNHAECPDDSCTWTFYKLGTVRETVTIRWLGSSNGYYSESVDFVRLNS